MRMKFAAASLVTLAIFMGTANAEDAQVSKPAEPAVEAAPAALPEAVLALVNDRRTPQELSDDELKLRAKMARRALKIEGVPDDIRAQIQALMDADRAELETRVATQQPAAPPAVQEAAPQPEPQPEKVAEPAPAPAPETVAEIPPEVTDLLNDGRALDELDGEQLAARAKLARQYSRNEALPEDVRSKLSVIGKQARAAMVAREKTPVVAEPAPVQEAAPQVEPAPVVEQSGVTSAEAPAPVVVAPVVVDKVDVKELDGNAGDPEAEKRAKAFLNDPTPADSLSDDDLRARLDAMRDLMAENELSVKTERALRDKLRVERPVLRERMAKVKAAQEAQDAQATQTEQAQTGAQVTTAEQQPVPQPADEAPKKKFRPNINIIITADTPVREILRDRREADVLDESELRYRIRARRDFETSPQFREYDETQREEWRQDTRNQRMILRQRLQEDRHDRQVELRKPGNIRRIVIEDNTQMANADIPEDVFAAEVEDSDIERALLAAPRKKIIHKVKADDIADNPSIRKAMTRIEIDTIRFGFNEAFVREEEVDNLDQIASVIERVLAKYPREVFLIEGHTDAVGSDAYNDKLSKARAEAVKKALTTYYIIPAKNLQTVGLGERYLKIPTADQEQENRRVSLSRATAVVGEAEE